jgi:hypothetical protein
VKANQTAMVRQQVGTTALEALSHESELRTQCLVLIGSCCHRCLGAVDSGIGLSSVLKTRRIGSGWGGGFVRIGGFDGTDRDGLTGFHGTG